MDLSFSWLEVEFLVRILISVILGAIIGFERELNHKPAGLRTHIFIAMGSCLFTISSFYLLPLESGIASADVTRIAAGIVTGAAFIGAGSVIASRENIKGLTTAASIWIVAAIGMMIGLGAYIYPIFATVIAFIVLRLARYEKKKC